LTLVLAAGVCAVAVDVASRQVANGPTATAGSEKPAAGPIAPRLDRQGDLLPEHALARLCTLRWRTGRARGSSVLFLPDGERLLFADRDVGTDGKALRLWDAATGKIVRSLGRGLIRPHALVLAPDGKTLLLSHSPDGGACVVLWDTQADRELRRWPVSEVM